MVRTGQAQTTIFLFLYSRLGAEVKMEYDGERRVPRFQYP
jgi:hypothetical protein